MRRSKKRGKAKQNKKLIWLAIAVLAVGIGFAALQKYLNINGNASIDSNFDVRISNITKGEVVGEAYEKEDATYTDTTATFNVGLKNVGDSLTYEVKVSNTGNTTAKLESIDVSEEGSSNISYEVTGISEGDIINSNDEKTVYVKTTYSGDESEASEKSLTVTLLFKQTTNSGYDIYDVGDEITLGTEHFYVIKDNGDTVTALAKYNLLVGKAYDANIATHDYPNLTEEDEGYGIQNAKAKGEMLDNHRNHIPGEDVIIGTIAPTDNINNFLSFYKNYITNQIDNNDFSLSLLKYNQAKTLGCAITSDGETCVQSGYNWLYTSNYFLEDFDYNEATSQYFRKCITNYGYVVGASLNMKNSYGLRPTITISKSVLN